jgi:hypothetical protein
MHNEVTGANAGGLYLLPALKLWAPASLRSCEKIDFAKNKESAW